MRLLLTGFMISVGIYILIVLLAYSFQRKLLYFPDTNRPNLEILEKHGLVPVPIHKSDSGQLISLWRAPQSPDHPVIIHFHGNGGGTTTRIGAYRAMAIDGIGVLAVGYPGYNGNPGVAGEVAFYAAAQANYDWLIESGIKPDRLVIVGQSLGTGIATWLATENDAAGLILEAAYTGMDDMAQRQFPYLPARLLIKDQYRSIDRITDINMPLSWIHGMEDELIPFAMGKRLFDSAAFPKSAHPIDNGGHNDLWQRGIDRIIRDEAYRFVAPSPRARPR